MGFWLEITPPRSGRIYRSRLAIAQVATYTQSGENHSTHVQSPRFQSEAFCPTALIAELCPSHFSQITDCGIRSDWDRIGTIRLTSVVDC